MNDTCVRHGGKKQQSRFVNTITDDATVLRVRNSRR